MIQISEEAGRLLRELAQKTDRDTAMRIAAELLAETGHLANTPSAKYEWSGVSQRA